MNLRYLVLLFLLLSACQKKDADLLIKNGKIWTGDSDWQWATWVAVKDGKILALGDQESFGGEAVRTIDLNGRLMIPGFNDSHVHFAQAGHLLLNVNLLDVNTQESFVDAIRQTTKRLPSGSWITGGDWGAYEAWSMGSSGGKRKSMFKPSRDMIDSLTKDYPLLVTRYDRKMGLANARALEFFGIDSEDGIVKGAELDSLMNRIPEKSFEQKLAEARRGLEECRKWGLTTVQDMSPPDELEVYQTLQKDGELTCRINFCPSRLIEYTSMKEKGWTINWEDPKRPHPAGDEWISFGTIKTHIDGIMGARSARFFEPYSDNDVENVAWRGGWREFSRDIKSFKTMLLAADAANIQLRIHSIGDEANSILLDFLDTLDQVNGARPRRFRIVHAQVIRPSDFERFRKHEVIAEVQPYHVTDDMRWMEERIGHERCKGAYAFKTLMDNGCVLSFGSDWPGTNASYYPNNPLMGLYAAVTRQTTNGEPAEGWFPEQRIGLEAALRAYTYGSAYGAFEEGSKGTISPGKLADFTVLHDDLFNTPPSAWLKSSVDYTIVGGQVVWDGNSH